MKRTSIALKCRLLGDICASGGMRLEAARVYREAAGNENLTAREPQTLRTEKAGSSDGDFPNDPQ